MGAPALPRRHKGAPVTQAAPEIACSCRYFFLYKIVYVSYFGRKHNGSIMGFANMLKFIGVAVGPVLYAIFRDVSGSYRTPLIVSCATTLACTVFSVKMHLPDDHMPYVPEIPLKVDKAASRRDCIETCGRHSGNSDDMHPLTTVATGARMRTTF
jgi:hypothetical protein